MSCRPRGLFVFRENDRAERRLGLGRRHPAARQSRSHRQHHQDRSRERNYGLAEKHFRKSVEKLPRDGEGWLGLAASYDRLKRYDLADRAYKEAVDIYGPRPEVLNNIGYSLMLRGDLRKARAKFTEAQAKDPDNPTIANNIALIDEAARRKKGVN